MSLCSVDAMLRKLAILSSARKRPLLAISMVLMAITICATLWGIVRVHSSTFWIALLVLLVLLSAAEGALALAFYRATSNASKDCENQIIRPSTVRSDLRTPTQTIPAVPLRNFSLPRERCLDASPPTLARPLPIPPRYVATGFMMNFPATFRPLPEPSMEDEDVPMPPSHVQLFEDIIIPPLKIRKTSRQSVQLPEQSATHGLNSDPHENSCVEKQSSLVSDPSLIDDENKLINNSTTVEADHDIKHEDDEKVTLLPYDYALADVARYHGPGYLLAPLIQIQPATPTTPVPPPTTTYPNTTIRVVDTFLQVPERVHHGSLRRKW